MDTDYKKALKKAVLFHDIDNNDYNILINCISPQIKQFMKNEIIILTGDAVQYIGVILTGSAVAYLESINGERTIMANLTPGRVFGEILVSTRTHQSPVTIYATTDVTAAFIEYRKIYSMCENSCASHKIFLQNMLKIIGDKYFYLFDRINILSKKTLREKIMAYLYSLIDRAEFENKTVIIPFSKTMLADYLLTNRSALSRELGKMEQDGLIEISGREFKLN